MKRMTLRDSDVLYGIEMSAYDRQQNIQRLKSPEIYVFTNDTEDAIIAMEPAFGDVDWLSIHVWTAPTARGKSLKTLFCESGIWVVDNTRYNVLMGVVPADNRKYALFLGMMGAECVAEVNGTRMYAVDGSKRKQEFQEKLKKLKE